jgi:hypothetical protein
VLFHFRYCLLFNSLVSSFLTSHSDVLNLLVCRGQSTISRLLLRLLLLPYRKVYQQLSRLVWRLERDAWLRRMPLYAVFHRSKHSDVLQLSAQTRLVLWQQIRCRFAGLVISISETFLYLLYSVSKICLLNILSPCWVFFVSRSSRKKAAWLTSRLTENCSVLLQFWQSVCMSVAWMTFMLLYKLSFMAYLHLASFLGPSSFCKKIKVDRSLVPSRYVSAAGGFLLSLHIVILLGCRVSYPISNVSTVELLYDLARFRFI